MFLLLASAASAVPAVANEWDSFPIIVLKLAVILFLVLLNGFFVAAEFAIVKVRASQLESLAADGDKRVALAQHVTAHLDAYLSATQLGITLASLALGWLGEPFVAAMIEPFFVRVGVTSVVVIDTVAFAIAFLTITFLHIVLGELAPKTLAIRKSISTTLWVSRPLGFFYVVFKPAITLLNGAANLILKHLFRLEPMSEAESAHNEEELRIILSESARSTKISPLEQQLLMNVLDLRELSVRDVMTPRGEVVFLNTEDAFTESVKRAIESGYSRFPLCVGDLDHAIGLVHAKELLRVGANSADILQLKRPLTHLPELMPLGTVLPLFLRDHVHLALVVDEFGGSAGIVALEDVLEKLVGEIQDEFDAEQPEFQRISETEFAVSATTSLHDLRAFTELDLENADVSTIGGYVMAMTGHIPREGQQVRIRDYLVTVSQSSQRRIEKHHFVRVQQPALEE